MKQIYINEFEKAASDDINEMQLAQAQSVQDYFLYRFFATPSSGVFGTDLTVSYVSALQASIAAGVGFYYDSAQTGNTPKFRMIRLSGAVAANLTAAHATLNRIDRICLAPNFAVSSTANRYVKTGGTGPITLTSVNKEKEMTYTLNVVAGTASGSPSAPATPAGHISLATVLVTAVTGMSGAGAVTDTRSVFSLSVSATGHYIMTSGTFQAQLDDADSWMSTMKFVTSGLSGASIAATLSQTTHGGRLLQVDTSAASSAVLTLPALSSNSGMRCWINDLKGAFGTQALTLTPNGTDKIMGLNSNYLLEANWGTWMLWGDSTNGWMLK